MCFQEKDKVKQWNEWHAPNRNESLHATTRYKSQSPREQPSRHDPHDLGISEVSQDFQRPRTTEPSRDEDVGRFKRSRTEEPDHDSAKSED